MFAPKFNKKAANTGTGINAALDAEGRTALHMAVAQKDMAEVQKLIRVGAHPDQPDAKGQSPVFYAITTRNIEMVSLLVSHGADLDARDKERRNAFEWAIEQKCDVPFLAHLQKLGADPAAPAPVTRRNALHRAAEVNRPDVIEYLAAQGMPLNGVDGKGNSAIIAAVETKSLAALSTLMTLGADPVLRNSDIETALHIAARGGDEDSVKKLLSHADVRHNINAYRSFDEGFSPLMVAAENNEAAIVKLMVAVGADVNQVDNRKRNSLYIAVQNGHVETAKTLLSLGVDAVKTTRQNKNNAPLVLQIGEENYAEMLTVLFQAGVDLNAATTSGETALAKACEQTNLEKVKALLALGADPNLANGMGRRPLDIVLDHYSYSYAFGEHNALIAALLQKGANPDMSPLPEMFEAPLHLAAGQGNVKSLELLLAHHAKIDVRDRSPAALTPLMAAIRGGQTRAAQFLIAKGADLNVTDRQGNSLLHYAAESNSEELIKFLMTQKGMSITAADKDGQTPLHLAARADRQIMMKFLLKEGADPVAFDNNGLTPLHAALVDSYNNDIFDAYKSILGDKAPLDATTRDTGETPLHYAAKYGRQWSVQKLLEMGADPLKTAKDGHLPLEDALAGSHFAVLPDLIEKMKQKGFDINAYCDAQGDTLLHKMAALPDNEDRVSCLVSAGISIESKNALGETALMLAIKNNRAQNVETLLMLGADVMAASAAGESIFDMAIQGQNQEILQHVLLALQHRQSREVIPEEKPVEEKTNKVIAPKPPVEKPDATQDKAPATPEKKTPAFDPKVLQKPALRLPPPKGHGPR